MYENEHVNPKIEHFYFPLSQQSIVKLQYHSLLYFLAQKVH